METSYLMGLNELHCRLATPYLFNIPHNPFYMNFMNNYWKSQLYLFVISSFDPRKSSIFHISCKAKSLAKRQRMSKTSIISISISLIDPLESSEFLISYKHIKGINKETWLRKNLHFTQVSKNTTKQQHGHLPKSLLKFTDSLHSLVQSLCTEFLRKMVEKRELSKKQ